jgi:membrane protease YdiL (CAAX protease family)
VSARAEAVRRSPAGIEALSWLAVPVGLALLFSRLWIVETGSSRAPLFALIFATLTGLSLAAPASRLDPRWAAADRAGPLPTPAVVAAGLGAVGLAAAASTLPGPALPIARGPVVLALTVSAAIAEEAFFRRLLYGRLVRWGAAVAVVGSGAAFGLMHVPLHGVAALPATMGAGLLLSWQRWATGGWAAPAATHAVTNIVVVLR